MPSSTHKLRVVRIETCSREDRDRLTKAFECARESTLLKAYSGAHYDEDEQALRLMFDAGLCPKDQRREEFAFCELLVSRILSELAPWARIDMNS